ncbi:YhcN/YlaJ family sporulation lipoprotein [Bacillus sp. CECT 9360]|uniref:YhcN/YlaJ family sporulation lipoprotein n=1 Tax=Bacillus sp. CECT 9360 TaxID=2845821 RepID=UPI001E46E2EE|nr:YhcN/YlaJ family sporulation lipoprotein [Bacillus sp. CECT 9360]
MRKFFMVLPFCVILCGCGFDDNEAVRPAGYYSTDEDDLVRRINYQAPITHMYQDMNAVERRQEATERQGGNPTIPLSTYGDGYFYHDSSFSTRDTNYHGHISKPQTPRSSYYTAYDGRLVDQIRARANRVNNVNDSRAVIYKGDILVTALLEDISDPQAVRNAIEKSVRPLVGKHKLHVTTDQGVYYRSIALDNRMRKGDRRDMFDQDAADMFENIEIHENHLQ